MVLALLIYKSPWYFQWSFESTGLLVQDKKIHNRFYKDDHLGFLIRMILAIFDFKTPWYFLPSFDSTGLIVQKKFKIDFQAGDCGSHIGFPIWTNLTIFEIQVTQILPTKFRINWPFASGFWLSWGLTTRQPLWVVLCRLPEKGRK